MERVKEKAFVSYFLDRLLGIVELAKGSYNLNTPLLKIASSFITSNMYNIINISYDKSKDTYMININIF
jgi:hypothetical protein